MRAFVSPLALLGLILFSFPAQSQQENDPKLIVIKIRPFSVLGSDPPGEDVSRCNWSWASGGTVRGIFKHLLKEDELQGTMQINKVGQDQVVTFALRSVSNAARDAFRNKFQRRIKEQLQCAA